jgi:class 3 adenylate cyclase
MAFEHHWTDSAPAKGTIRRLSSRAQLTIFDAAGTGASQRDAIDFSLETQVRAIEAVATHLPAAQFTLIGSGTATPSAALYAAQHPARVRGLVCLFPALPIVRRKGAAIRDNWSLDRRRMAGATFPDGPVSGQRWYSNAMRESMTAEVHAAYRATFADADLRAIYQGIPVPTLLCIPQEGPAREASLALASVVPNCRVATTPYVGDEVLAAILEFMGIKAAPDSAAVILLTDIVDSTAHTERLGDEAFRAASRALDASIRSVIRDASGTPIEGKVLGDGVMGVFATAAHALRAAMACVELSERSELRLHVGIHAGDVIHEEGNVYGGTVNIASRICNLSAPGEILVSDVVRGMARSSAGVDFEDRGEKDMKGVGESVRVYAVRQAE